jgi:hypothetical protein
VVEKQKKIENKKVVLLTKKVSEEEVLHHELIQEEIQEGAQDKLDSIPFK